MYISKAWLIVVPRIPGYSYEEPFRTSTNSFPSFFMFARFTSSSKINLVFQIFSVIQRQLSALIMLCRLALVQSSRDTLFKSSVLKKVQVVRKKHFTSHFQITCGQIFFQLFAVSTRGLLCTRRVGVICITKLSVFYRQTFFHYFRSFPGLILRRISYSLLTVRYCQCDENNWAILERMGSQKSYEKILNSFGRAV